jgi:response regulator RpfG family c-di-GMP phosphodiesterase
MHVLSWLKERGALTPAQYEGVLHQAERTGDRVEEAILDSGALSELELLKLLASRYGTRFVSTDKLSGAKVDKKTLDCIPRKLAEHLHVFPIVFDRKAQALSVVVAAPGEDDVEKQVQVVTGVREVRAYVARPAAIRALILKHYDGNQRAFEAIAQRADAGIDAFEVFETAPIGGPSTPGPDSGFDDPFSFMGSPDAPAAHAPAHTPARAAVPAPSPTAPAASPGARAPTLALDGTIPIEFSASEGEKKSEPGISLDDLLETLNVFVSLLERERGELRGHSGQVARLCRSVAERVGLSAADRHALLVAAYLHDVGKSAGNYHLTALNVARYEGHRSQAQKTLFAPVKLFESAPVPEEAKRILRHLYERFDGQGFPDRLAGKDIPYGARVLALVETYADLTGNARNPYRKVLTAPQALSVLYDLGGQLFDPTLADLLRHVVVGEQGTDELGARPRVLVVDPDPEETTVLEMRLIEHGFAVDTARDLASAEAKLEDPPDVIVSEVDLGGGSDGFDLLRRVSRISESDRPAFIFLTSRADRDSVTKGFDLGVTDFLVKPASAELVATKAGQAVEGAARQRAGGVSGSLKEMSLPDVVQIFANGRKGGRLQIVSAGLRGEVHFADGQVHDARFGDIEGEDAFYAMLKLGEGTFSLDPTFKCGNRVIHVSSEGLLLEGMRRLDEGL